MANQDLRFRRRATTVGDQQTKRNLPLILAVAASGLIIVPALIYTAMHPSNVGSTVKQLAKHIPMPVKDIRIAIVASRTTPAPPRPTPSATPASKAPKLTAAQRLHLAHLAHLKRARALAAAAAAGSATNLASIGQASDVSASTAGTQTTGASPDAGAATASTTSSVTGPASSGANALPSSANAAGGVTSATPSGTKSSGTGSASPVAASPSAAAGEEDTTGADLGADRASTSPDTAATSTPATVAVASHQQPAADATPIYAPQIVVEARFKNQVQPDYPDIAKAQNAQGTAVVLATIGPQGQVISTRLDQSTGNKLLDQSALAAARQSSFEPPKINGKPATETYRLVYTFAL